MAEQQLSDVDLLCIAYIAFNARDIDGALAVMSPNVAWPKAFKGGFANGHQEVREYWTEQWSEINPRVQPTAFYSEGEGRSLVNVHQVVYDLEGNVVFDGQVGHRFTISGGLISRMEVCPPPAPDLGS